MKKFNINQVLCIIIILLLVILIYKQTIRNEQFYSDSKSEKKAEFYSDKDYKTKLFELSVGEYTYNKLKEIKSNFNNEISSIKTNGLRVGTFDGGNMEGGYNGWSYLDDMPNLINRGHNKASSIIITDPLGDNLKIINPRYRYFSSIWVGIRHLSDGRHDKLSLGTFGKELDMKHPEYGDPRKGNEQRRFKKAHGIDGLVLDWQSSTQLNKNMYTCCMGHLDAKLGWHSQHKPNSTYPEWMIIRCQDDRTNDPQKPVSLPIGGVVIQARGWDGSNNSRRWGNQYVTQIEVYYTNDKELTFSKNALNQSQKPNFRHEKKDDETNWKKINLVDNGKTRIRENRGAGWCYHNNDYSFVKFEDTNDQKNGLVYATFIKIQLIPNSNTWKNHPTMRAGLLTLKSNSSVKQNHISTASH